MASSGAPFLVLGAVIIPVLFGARSQQAERTRRLKRLAEEEEVRTSYAAEELMGDYEFKIIRNELNLFDDPALFEQALREEGRAGWQFVEKFDGNRVRLKRRKNSDVIDSVIELDPYDAPPNALNPYRTEVLQEVSRQTCAAKRKAEMMVLGWGFCVSVGLAAFLWAAAKLTNNVGAHIEWAHLLLVFMAFCATIPAVLCALCLVVRPFHD